MRMKGESDRWKGNAVTKDIDLCHNTLPPTPCCSDIEGCAIIYASINLRGGGK